MAVAIVQDWHEEETDRSTTNYDAINKRLTAAAEPPEGFVLHTAGFTGHGFRIFEVWESREHFERFVRERLEPALAELTPDNATRPELTIYDLHNVIVMPER